MAALCRFGSPNARSPSILAFFKNILHSYARDQCLNIADNQLAGHGPPKAQLDINGPEGPYLLTAPAEVPWAMKTVYCEDDPGTIMDPGGLTTAARDSYQANRYEPRNERIANRASKTRIT
jgi:hypothetical protein